MREAPRRRAMPSAVAFVTAVVVVAVASWSMLARARAGAEPLPELQAQAAHDVVAPDLENGANAVVVAPATAALDSPRTAGGGATGVIRGVVRDASGLTVPGWAVRLLQAPSGRRESTQYVAPKAGSSVRTGDDGTFVFEHLVPGSWNLGAGGWSLTNVVLSAGEERHVDLDLPHSGVVVTCHLSTHGVPAENWRVLVPPTEDLDGFAMSDANGDAVLLLPPGEHRAAIRSVVGGVTPRYEWSISRTIVVPPNVRVHRCAFDLPQTKVTMAMVGAPPPDDLGFVVDGRVDDCQEPLHAVVDADDGHATLRLPPGRFTIGLRAKGLVEVVAQEVVTGVAATTRVEIAATLACPVYLELRRPDGRCFSMPQHSPVMLALLPELVVGDRHYAPEVIGDRDSSRAGAAVLWYPAVPLGTATLRVPDRPASNGRLCLPFEPIEPRPVAVTTGENRAIVTVQPRAFVELTGCTSYGMQDTRSIVRVYEKDTLVWPVCSPDQSRWQGFLPAGEYRALVQRGDVTTETKLLVQNDAIALRLKP